ncbi:MAG: lipoyl(octanoyl) transferase LipB [Fimbriimonadaceae bacterium]|nr:lipoyl(octanoyl) transferase LipB [Fimbriimonadaceae bacterium]
MAISARVANLGRMAYRPCAELQAHLLERVASEEVPDTLLFVEHAPVLTLGANFHEENLLLPPEAYRERGIAVERTDRGGDVTYHGPDQLVAYPIFNLAHFGKDLHRWLRELEEAVIVALASFGLEGERFPPHTGVWVAGKKVCAIGIKVRKWTSMHGIALNCSNSLEPFGLIVPCGIEGHGVTSLTELLGRKVGIEEALPVVQAAFGKVFGVEFEAVEGPLAPPGERGA